MFKRSLVWLLIVLTVLLMALPMTVFANEGDDTATVSDEGGEAHEHTWVADTNDADTIIEYCTGCTFVKESVSDIRTNIYGSKSGTANVNDEGNLVSAEFDGGTGLKVSIKYATPKAPDASGGFENFTTTYNRMRIDKNATVTITYEDGEFDALYWHFPLAYSATGTSAGARSSRQFYSRITEGTFLEKIGISNATVAFVNENVTAANPMGYAKITFDSPVKSVSFKTDNADYYVGNFKIDGTKTYDAGQDHPHTYSDPVTVAPSCYTEGYDSYICEVCGFEKKENIQPAIGSHDWVEGDCRTETICNVCGKSGGYNHAWVEDTIANNGASHYCESCASYKIDIGVSPSNKTVNEITDEDGTVVQYYFENANKTVRLDAYPSATGTMPATNSNTVRMKNGTTGVISVANGTFTEIDFYFSGNIEGPFGDSNPANKGAKWAYDEVQAGTFINYLVGVDSANITAVIQYNDDGSPYAVLVHVVLDAPVSELSFQSGYDNWYNSYIGVTNVIDVADEHTHDFQPVAAPDCTETVATDFVCADCGFGYAGELAPVGHTAGAVADCENDQTCTACGEVLAPKLGHSWADATLEAPKTCTVCGATEGEPLALASITGAQVNVGEDLAIKYLVYLPEGTNLESVILKVTNEGHGTYAELEGTLVEDGTYVFVYDNIAPQCMSDLLDAYLIIDGETVATVEDYSIVQNAKNLAAAEDATAELKQFLADLLAYGKAAQLYVSGEAVITDADIAEIGAAGTKAPTADTKVLGERVEGAAYIAGAGVRFDSEIQMFVLVSGDATVKVGGVEYEVVDGKAYLPGMSITEVIAPVVIELYEGDTLVHTVTYGVYDYVYSMIGSDDTAMATLALALYNCAESAKAYLD